MTAVEKPHSFLIADHNNKVVVWVKSLADYPPINDHDQSFVPEYFVYPLNSPLDGYPAYMRVLEQEGFPLLVHGTIVAMLAGPIALVVQRVNELVAKQDDLG